MGLLDNVKKRFSKEKTPNTQSTEPGYEKNNQEIEENISTLAGGLDFLSNAPGARHNNNFAFEQAKSVNFLPEELIISSSGDSTIEIQKKYLDYENKLKPFIELLKQLKHVENYQKLVGGKIDIKMPEEYSTLENGYKQAEDRYGNQRNYMFIPFLKQLEALGLDYNPNKLPTSIANMYEKYKNESRYSQIEQEKLGILLVESFGLETLDTSLSKDVVKNSIGLGKFFQYCNQNQHIDISKKLAKFMATGQKVLGDSTYEGIQECFNTLDDKTKRFIFMPVMYDLEKRKDNIPQIGFSSYSSSQMFTDLGFSEELQKEYKEFKLKKYSEQEVELKLAINLLKKMNVLNENIPSTLALTDLRVFGEVDRAMYGKKIDEIINIINSIQPPIKSKPENGKSGYADCIADKSLRQEQVNTATKAIVADKQDKQDLEMMMRANSINELE